MSAGVPSDASPGSLLLVDSKGTARPDSLAPFSWDRSGTHWLLRDGLRRKSVLTGEVFHWDGMLFVVLEDTSRPSRLSGGGPAGRSSPFGLSIEGPLALARSLPRLPSVRRLCKAAAVAIALIACLAMGRFFAPDPIAFAPSFEQTTQSLHAYRLFHMLLLVPEAPLAPLETAAGLEEPMEFARNHRAFQRNGEAQTAPSEPGEPTRAGTNRDRQPRDGRVHAPRATSGRAEALPSRYFLSPGE